MDWLFQLSLLIYFSWFWSHVSRRRSVHPFGSLFLGVALKWIVSFLSYRSFLALLSACLACLCIGTRSRTLEWACKGSLWSRYRFDFHRSRICSCIILAHSSLGDTWAALSSNDGLVQSLTELSLLCSLAATLCTALGGRGRDWTSFSLSSILSFLEFIISLRLGLILSHFRP